mgnify:FL=1
MNAANEIAVEAFLAGSLGFPAIARSVEGVLVAADKRGLLGPMTTLSEVIGRDQVARDLARTMLQAYI